MQMQRICAVVCSGLALGCVAEIGSPNEGAKETTELAAAPMDRIAHCASHPTEEAQSLALINSERVQAGLPALERVWRIDILTGIDGVTFQEAWAGRDEADFYGISLPIIGRRELLKKKRASGRKKDEVDVALLEEGEEA